MNNVLIIGGSSALGSHCLSKVPPEDIASMANFLLSSQGQWITGQIMKVDGGVSSVKV